MKYIITESQLVNITIRRRLDKIKELFNKRMTAYPPCDYDYEDGFIDYYADVRWSIVDVILDELNQYDVDTDEGEHFLDELHKVIYNMFYQEARDFYDGVIEMGCEEYEEGDGEEDDN
jgi:hypothetical protein